MRYRSLYAGILIGLLLLVIASMGSGIIGVAVDYGNWQYRMFRGICHQMIERSFQINGIPMAVNTRCFGVFTGLFVSWLFIPALKNRVKNKKWPVFFLIIVVILQIGDYVAGLFSVWNSSNFSRFFMGNLLGAAIVCMIADQFSAKPKSSK